MMGTELRTFFLWQLLIKDGITLVDVREVVFAPSGLGAARGSLCIYWVLSPPIRVGTTGISCRSHRPAPAVFPSSRKLSDDPPS